MRICEILNLQSAICNRQFPATTLSACGSKRASMVVASPRSSPSPTIGRAIRPVDRSPIDRLMNRQHVVRHRARRCAALAAATPPTGARCFPRSRSRSGHRRASRRAAAEGPRPASGGRPGRCRSTARRTCCQSASAVALQRTRRVARQASARAAAARRQPRDRRANRTRARTAARHGRAGPGDPPGARLTTTTPSPATVSTRTPLTASTSTWRDRRPSRACQSRLQRWRQPQAAAEVVASAAGQWRERDRAHRRSR